MGLRDVVYRLYERSLEAGLSPGTAPRHIGVILDGNRRWARSMGLADVSTGHQRGADKISELLQWSQETGVEVVTLWLLSTDNLSRPARELDPLLAIIEKTVEDLAAEGWRGMAADPRFDVVVQPSLSTLVFRYIPAAVTDPAEIDRANLYARKALFASGDAVVAGTKVGGRHYLKFTLLNPETTTADITAVLDLIAGHAEQYLGESLDRAS